jgi:predicted dehydrogenase
MERPLNFGIAGCGVIGPTHAQGLRSLPGVNVTWACDLVAEKAEAMAGEFAIANTCTDFAEMLSDGQLDAVCVCTDHASHVPIATAAMDAGKHVLVEKALAAGNQGLEQLSAAARRNPGVLFGGVFQHRFDPEYRLIKRLVDEGAFGTVLTANVILRCLRTKEYYRGDPWRGTWDLEGGAVCINQAIHFIDTLLWILGGAKSLCGAWSNRTRQDVMDTEDTAVAMFRFANGAIGTLEATCASNIRWEPTLSIHGSDGAIEVRNEQLVKAAFAKDHLGDQVRAEFVECRKAHAEQLGKSYYGTGHLPLLSDFVHAIREGREPYVTGESARKTVEAVLAIYESQASQAWVNLEPRS